MAALFQKKFFGSKIYFSPVLEDILIHLLPKISPPQVSSKIFLF